MRVTPRIVSVTPKENYVLALVFENGVEKTYDVKPLLTKPVFKPLSDPAVFNAVRIDRIGSITWGGCMDCCKDVLYAAK